jgi:O-methyltransferase involved in polyketide biosynthesis
MPIKSPAHPRIPAKPTEHNLVSSAGLVPMYLPPDAQNRLFEMITVLSAPHDDAELKPSRRKPRRVDHTICTAIAPEAVFTVRT